MDFLLNQNLEQITQADFISDVQDLRSLSNALEKEVINEIKIYYYLLDYK